MKNTIFLMLLALSLQGFAQMDPGVYTSNETWYVNWTDEGLENHGDLVDEEPFFIEVRDHGFRIYNKEGDSGSMYSAMYVTERNGWDIYSVYPDEKIEYKDGHLVWFYDFNYDTGYYKNSQEFRNVTKVK